MGLLDRFRPEPAPVAKKRAPYHRRTPAEMDAQRRRLQYLDEREEKDFLREAMPELYLDALKAKHGMLNTKEKEISVDTIKRVLDVLKDMGMEVVPRGGEGGGAPNFLSGLGEGLGDLLRVAASNPQVVSSLMRSVAPAIDHQPTATTPPLPPYTAPIPQPAEPPPPTAVAPAVTTPPESGPMDTQFLIRQLDGLSPPQVAQKLTFAAKLDPRAQALLNDLLKTPPNADSLATYLLLVKSSDPLFGPLVDWFVAPQRFDWFVQSVVELHKMHPASASPLPGPGTAPVRPPRARSGL